MNRRIAVIQIPREQRSRLGRLGIIRAQNWVAGPDTVSLNSWTPVADLVSTLLANSSSITPEQWQAQILQNQSQAAISTPGTLVYTPAPSPPSGAMVEPPWSSWSTQDCNPEAGNVSSIGSPSPAAAAAAAAAGTDGSDNGWLIAAGIIGALASLMYLKNSNARNGR